MVRQGFLGALEQYWTVEPKARLHRRNSWAREHEPSHSDLVVGMYVSIIATISLFVVVMVGAIL